MESHFINKNLTKRLETYIKLYDYKFYFAWENLYETVIINLISYR